MNYLQQFKHFLYKGFIPVTKGTIVFAVVIFLLTYALPFLSLPSLLGLSAAKLLLHPWSLITYPLVNPDPFSLLFASIWLWFAGGSLERTWGGPKYFRFLLYVSALTGILMTMAVWLSAPPILITGLWLPLTGITWAWAGIYPDRELLFMGLIPVKARWMGWFILLYTFIVFSRFHLLMGLASAGGISIFYLFRNSSRGRWGRGPSFKKMVEEWRHRKKKEKFKIIK